MGRRFGLVFFILLTSGITTMGNCSTIHLVSMRGESIANVIDRLGPPDTTIKRPDGSVTYIFEKITSRAGDAPASPQVGVSGSRPVITVTNVPTNRQGITLKCTIIYEVNSRGRIIQSRQFGNGC